MSQPEWITVYKTDCDALYRDATGVYPPELEHAEDNGDGTFSVYRVTLDKCTLGADGRLVDVVDHKGVPHNAWFEDDVHDGWEHTPLHGWQPTTPKAAQCKLTSGKSRYCPVCERWVSCNLSGAAESSGVDVDELRRKFCSDDPADLAHAYEVVLSHHGWANGDEYPLTLTEDELDERWASKGD